MTAHTEVHGPTPKEKLPEAELAMDLRIDAPFGPVHVRSTEDAIVIGAGGVLSFFRMMVWTFRNRTFEPSAALRLLTGISGRRVVLRVAPLLRLTVARP